MTSDSLCRSYAYLDVGHRRRKAEKIVRIISAECDLKGLDVLEIGAGSVRAVDLIDERLVSKGYEFSILKGVPLPFADDTFDLVISNHVIEHVGGKPEQMTHLSEISRVLRPSGIGYLALPNRSALREPHFRLWFLSWLPRSLCEFYVRYAKKGSRYDWLASRSH